MAKREIAHVQGQRNPSKMVGAGVAVRRCSGCPREKEKPQQDEGANLYSESNPILARFKNLGCTRTRDATETETEQCLDISLWRLHSSGLTQEQRLWLQQNWVWYKLLKRRSPLTPSESHQN